MAIQPYIIGQGMSGQAIAKALGIAALHRQIALEPIHWVGREENLSEIASDSLVCVANPHGLHEARLREIKHVTRVLCEKPVGVSLEQCETFAEGWENVAVAHVYRMQWGPQWIGELVRSGEMGELISVEGRLWHSGASETASGKSWKQDPKLNGGYDILLDLGTHWVDMACYFVGDFAPKTKVSLSYTNAPAAHRDTHAMVNLSWGDLPGFVSVSKTSHGFGNHFEINVIGKKMSANWQFENPDGVWVGRGKQREWIPRTTPSEATGLAPFHGLGWLEGYAVILSELLRQGASGLRLPRATESASVVKALIQGID